MKTWSSLSKQININEKMLFQNEMLLNHSLIHQSGSSNQEPTWLIAVQYNYHQNQYNSCVMQFQAEMNTNHSPIHHQLNNIQFFSWIQRQNGQIKMGRDMQLAQSIISELSEKQEVVKESQFVPSSQF